MPPAGLEPATLCLEANYGYVSAYFRLSLYGSDSLESLTLNSTKQRHVATRDIAKRLLNVSANVCATALITRPMATPYYRQKGRLVHGKRSNWLRANLQR